MIFDKYIKTNLVLMTIAICFFTPVIFGWGEYPKHILIYSGWFVILLQFVVLIIQNRGYKMKRDLPAEFWSWFKEGLKKRPIFTGEIPDV